MVGSIPFLWHMTLASSWPYDRPTTYQNHSPWSEPDLGNASKPPVGTPDLSLDHGHWWMPLARTAETEPVETIWDRLLPGMYGTHDWLQPLWSSGFRVNWEEEWWGTH